MMYNFFEKGNASENSSTISIQTILVTFITTLIHLQNLKKQHLNPNSLSQPHKQGRRSIEIAISIDNFKIVLSNSKSPIRSAKPLPHQLKNSETTPFPQEIKQDHP